MGSRLQRCKGGSVQMSAFDTARIMALKQGYPFQLTIKHWRKKCQAKELNYAEVQKLLQLLNGASWYQSRRSGHKVFGFATRADLESFTKLVVNLKETNP